MTATLEPTRTGPDDEQVTGGPPVGGLEDELDAAADASVAAEDEAAEEERPATRLAIAIALPTIATAVMVGGVFIEISGRVYAGLAGLAGVGLAVLASRMRRPALANAVIGVGLFAIGLLSVLPSGIGNVFDVQELAGEAARSGDVLRPPVPFDPGWMAIVGWLMGIVGFSATWVAVVVRRPALGLLLPMPIAAFAGISVPDDAQVPSGLAVLVLFAIGLGLLSSEQSVGVGDERPSLGYELRKALKALPLIAVVTVALYLLAQTDFLFPPPVIDPAQEPQEPQTVPLTEVEDRVLFSVVSELSGPWRVGVLDVYNVEDGTWRLPPFAESELDEVPTDGFVDRRLVPAVNAEFTVAGLGGSVLPGLPNTVGIIADGPELSYDARSGNIRVSQGQVEAGLTYTVAAAGLPSIEDLQQTVTPVPEDKRRFLEAPDMPPAAATLVAQAEADFTNRWDRFDFLRTYVLDNVVASGPGSPVAIPPERVQEILTDLEGSPYEIVALQALFARWVEVPSRLGYGFDGGEVVDDVLQIRPRNGATFPEVYFEGFGWLPVIGTPKQAEPSVGSDSGEQQTDPNIVPSDDIAVQILLPVLVPAGSVLGEQILRIVLIVMPLAALALLAYTVWPAVRKARVRSRRRSAAQVSGPRARIALAYAEWRDHAADFGFSQPSDTPLMFLDRFVDDDEHTELAWLTTRSLWGDLRSEADGDMASAAEELSRTLRRRLASLQPGTMRAVAAVSRISLRAPYAPDTDLTRHSGRPSRKSRKERADATV